MCNESRSEALAYRQYERDDQRGSGLKVPNTPLPSKSLIFKEMDRFSAFALFGGSS